MRNRSMPCIHPGNLARFIHVAWGQILLAVVSIAGIRAYTELMSTTEFGHVMLALGGYALLDGLIVMAFSQTVALYCSRLRDTEEQRSLAAGLFLDFLRWWLILVPIILAIAAVVCLISGIGGATAFLLCITTCMYLASETAKAAMMTLLNVNSEHSRFSAWLVAEACISLFAVAGALLLGPRNAVTFIHAYVIAKIATTAFFYYRFYAGRFFACVDRRVLLAYRAEAIRYGVPFSAMAVIGWLSNYVDRYILNFISPYGVVGVYAAAAGTISRPFAISGAILSNYFRPILFSSTSEADSQKAQHVFRSWCVAALCTGALGVLGVYYLGPVLLKFLLAKEYQAGAIEIMLILSVGLTATIVCHSLDNLIFANGSSRPLVIPQVGSILVGILAVAVLAHRHGALGAAMGKVAGDLSKLLLTSLMLVILKRKSVACGMAS